MTSRRSSRRQKRTGSTSSQEASPVRTSPLPDDEQASPENGQGCGGNLPESFAYFDRELSLWKTPQGCFALLQEIGEPPLDAYSGSWPASGTMRNGRVYPLAPLELPRRECGSSSPPTLRARDWRDGRSSDEVFNRGGRPLNEVIHRMEHTPTLRATETDQGEYQSSGGKDVLTLKGMLKALDGVKVSERTAKAYTPTLASSSGAKGPRKTATKEENGGHQVNLVDVTAHLSGQAGGVLNPKWAEWYMGFPEGWCEIPSEDSETA